MNVISLAVAAWAYKPLLERAAKAVKNAESRSAAKAAIVGAFKDGNVTEAEWLAIGRELGILAV